MNKKIMKNKNQFINNHLFNKKYIFIIFLLLFLNYCSSVIQTGKFPYIKRLNNGNYIIISSTSIIFADNTLTNILKKMDFDSAVYTKQDNIGSTNVAQFPAEDNGYIIATVKDKLYIFSSYGIYKTEIDISFVSEKFTCLLITNGHSKNHYFFTLIYGETYDDDRCNNLIIKKGIFNSYENSINFNETFSYDLRQNIDNQEMKATISCDLMTKNNKDYIFCLYGNYNKLECTVFDPDNNYEIIQYNKNNIGGLYFKSVVLPYDRTKSIFCSFKSNEALKCLNYDIESNQFSGEQQIIQNGCGDRPSSLIMEYFYETEEFIIGCYGKKNQLYLSRYNKNLEKTNNYSMDNAFDENYENVGRVNIILPNNQNNYNLFFYPKSECEQCPIYEPQFMTMNSTFEINIIKDYPTTQPATFICTNNYYNYDHNECIDNIPDGYYCNDETERTIAKCHNNCKTCEIGPTEYNNNCLSCNENTIYFDLGNCVSECINGDFTENSIKKCKCSTNITCESCSEQSKHYNLCVTCNKGNGYYPKKDDINNIDEYINCYNNNTIGNSYYLNSDSNKYELCHSNCLKCSGAGSDINNECIICKEGMSLIKNKNNIINCYNKCGHYYYFDEYNNYQCTNDYKCHEGYKLINSTKKCIDNCQNDNIYNYKYEYNNICYPSCPIDTYEININSYICELKCKPNNKYFNYEKTQCIERIPDGYYCNDNLINTIEKCHSKCKTCEIGPTEINNNCLTCKESAIYFDLGNCTDTCVNGDFTEDDIKKCKCTSYKKCHYCSESSKNLGLCISCNEGYYKKKMMN